MNDVPRIYLIGFMGAGKSTVGVQLAEQLGFEFHDLDEVIEEETGKSIPELFREDGEERFRDLETQFLREQSRSSNPLVLATGGGVPQREENRQIMRETGITIYLDVDFDVIYDRIREGENRPLVPDGEDAYEELRSLWERRQKFYREADVVVELSDETPGAVVRELRNRLPDSIDEARFER